jgi:hypothetical protein
MTTALSGVALLVRRAANDRVIRQQHPARKYAHGGLQPSCRYRPRHISSHSHGRSSIAAPVSLWSGRIFSRSLPSAGSFSSPRFSDSDFVRRRSDKAKREQTPLTFRRKVRSLSQAYEDRHPRTVMPYAWRSLIHDFHDPGSVVLWEPAEVMTLDRSVRSTSAATPTGR